jgi:hypothetical protein
MNIEKKAWERGKEGGKQGVTKRCRLPWLTTVIASSYMRSIAGGGKGGVAGSQPMRKAVHRSPNKLWRSNSIFTLYGGKAERVGVGLEPNKTNNHGLFQFIPSSILVTYSFKLKVYSSHLNWEA